MLTIERRDSDGIYACKRCNEDYYEKSEGYCNVCEFLIGEMRADRAKKIRVGFSSSDRKIITSKIVPGTANWIDVGEVEGDKFFRT